MIKTLRLSIALLLSLAAIAAVGFVAYKLFFKEKDAVSVEASKIADIETLAELCTMEIYTDMPVKGILVQSTSLRAGPCKAPSLSILTAFHTMRVQTQSR